jgi:hypothetical protein
MNLEETEKILKKIHQFYIDEIKKVVGRIGSERALGRSLGKDGSYIRNVMKRNSFVALRRVIKEIDKKQI